MGRCEMIWTTAGTNRVCGRCMALKDTVVGHTDESGVTLPPLHPRCRCAIMYREIGKPKVLNPAKPPPCSEANESYRLITPKLPYKPVSEERYNQLIIPLKKMGVTIMRGADIDRLLDLKGAEGDTLDEYTVLFKQKVSISAILEETRHVKQNRQGLNNDKDVRLRGVLNEIDAKEYLLSVADKYKIPREETEATKIQLEMYKDVLKELEERFGE